MFQRFGHRASVADSSTMELQLDVSLASLGCFSPSVLLDERIKSRCPSERITTGGGNSGHSSPASSRFAAEIKTRGQISLAEIKTAVNESNMRRSLCFPARCAA